MQDGTPLATDAYDAAGRLASVSRANGAVTTDAYDGADRLRDRHTTVDGTTVSRYQYTVDRLGLRTAVTETWQPASLVAPTPTPEAYPPPTVEPPPPRPPLPSTRTITYTYDGLNRLTGATETPGTTYAYAYDLAGNRTAVWENGAQTQNLSYNAANQVIGWTYDAAGNRLSDGTTTAAYDALNRRTQHDGTSYTSNADGVLVSAGTTTSTQDLAAPLSQILADGSATYVYGAGSERLRAVDGPWFLGDALGRCARRSTTRARCWRRRAMIRGACRRATWSGRLALRASCITATR